MYTIQSMYFKQGGVGGGGGVRFIGTPVFRPPS